jgi:hypothetical protein
MATNEASSVEDCLMVEVIPRIVAIAPGPNNHAGRKLINKEDTKPVQERSQDKHDCPDRKDADEYLEEARFGGRSRAPAPAFRHSSEFTDALTEVLAENAVGPTRRGLLASARAAVKKLPDYSESAYLLALVTAFNNWEALQNVGREDRLSQHAAFKAKNLHALARQRVILCPGAVSSDKLIRQKSSACSRG